MEKDRRKRGGLTWMQRIWSMFIGATIAHGYRPFRAVFFLLLLIAIGRQVFQVAGDQGLMYCTTTDCAKDGQPLSPLVYSLDNTLPIIDLSQVEWWLPRGSGSCVVRAFSVMVYPGRGSGDSPATPNGESILKRSATEDFGAISARGCELVGVSRTVRSQPWVHEENPQTAIADWADGTVGVPSGATEPGDAGDRSRTAVVGAATAGLDAGGVAATTPTDPLVAPQCGAALAGAAAVATAA